MTTPGMDGIDTQAAIDAFKELVTESEPNKLPEHLFVQNFLPYFCGELDINTNKDVLPYWYSIAGSASKEVEIIDSSGKPIYRVPALADNSVIEPKKKRGNV